MNFKIDFSNLKQMDLHMHTTFSDGQGTPAEMVSSAIAKGLKVIGISDHSYTSIDESYCIKKESIQQYKNEVNGLKGNKNIVIYCGIEQDFFSKESTEDYDYVIGSVHYINPVPDVYIPVDENIEILRNAYIEYFQGDIYSLCEEYFKTVSQLAERSDVDIIGHFDLISKFNEGSELFDNGNPRYIKIWQMAADKLLKSGHNLFEINTGAISRGYKSIPYPSLEMIDYIKKRGGKFVFSSDSHSPANIAFGF